MSRPPLSGSIFGAQRTIITLGSLAIVARRASRESRPFSRLGFRRTADHTHRGRSRVVLGGSLFPDAPGSGSFGRAACTRDAVVAPNDHYSTRLNTVQNEGGCCPDPTSAHTRPRATRAMAHARRGGTPHTGGTTWTTRDASAASVVTAPRRAPAARRAQRRRAARQAVAAHGRSRRTAKGPRGTYAGRYHRPP